MHHTRGVSIRNFGRRQDPGRDALRLELYKSNKLVGANVHTTLYTKVSYSCADI
jgi:hypothetical protein